MCKLALVALIGFAPMTFAESLLSAPEETVEAAAMQNAEGIKACNGGDWDSAESYFKKAISIDPEFAEAHFNLFYSPYTDPPSPPKNLFCRAVAANKLRINSTVPRNPCLVCTLLKAPHGKEKIFQVIEISTNDF